MSDDEVRPDVGPLLERLIDGMRMPNGVLETPAAIVSLFGGAATQVILDTFDAGCHTGRMLRNESAAKTLVASKPSGHMAELRGEILMDEQDVHGRLFLPCLYSRPG